MTLDTKRCTVHAAAPATASVPNGEHAARYLCDPCLRSLRPIVFTSLHLPAVPVIR